VKRLAQSPDWVVVTKPSLVSRVRAPLVMLAFAAFWRWLSSQPGSGVAWVGEVLFWASLGLGFVSLGISIEVWMNPRERTIRRVVVVLGWALGLRVHRLRDEPVRIELRKDGEPPFSSWNATLRCEGGKTFWIESGPSADNVRGTAEGLARRLGCGVVELPGEA